MKAVIRTENTKGRSRPFLLVGLYGPVVADEGVLGRGLQIPANSIEGDSVYTTIIIRGVDELQLAPSLSLVIAEGYADVAATGTAESFQATIG